MFFYRMMNKRFEDDQNETHYEEKQKDTPMVENE